MTSKILGSLTLLILGFSIFVGTKNKKMYSERIESRKEQEALNVGKTNKLKATTTERDKQMEARLAKEAEAVELGKVLEEHKQKTTELTKQIDEKKDQIATQKSQIEQLNEALKSIGDIETLIPKVKALKNAIVQLKADIEGNEAKLSSLIAEQNSTQLIVSKYEEENAWRSAVQSNPTLTTRIGNIYESYGFVSLKAGNNSGIVGGSSLEIVRDNAVIGKLIVKAVEANTSTAEIIPGSLAQDTVLMEGDSVRSVVNSSQNKPAEVILPTDSAVPADEAPAEEAPPLNEIAPEAPADAIFE